MRLWIGAACSRGSRSRAWLFGGKVSVFPAGVIPSVAAQIPRAESYTFTAAEKGSHFMFWENLERFNSVVEPFITKQGTCTGGLSLPVLDQNDIYLGIILVCNCILNLYRQPDLQVQINVLSWPSRSS